MITWALEKGHKKGIIVDDTLLYVKSPINYTPTGITKVINLYNQPFTLDKPTDFNGKLFIEK